MNRRPLLVAALVAAAACSSLGDSGAPVAIEFLVPVPAVVDIGDTIQLRARVLDTNGDSVAAPIRWSTPDTNVHVDSVTGKFWATSGTTGHVQPRSGSLIGPSPATSFTVQRRADTLIIAAVDESLFVTVASDTASAPLAPKVAKADTMVGDQAIIFTLIAPTPAAIRLSGDVTTRTVYSGGSGTPATTVRVRKAGAAVGDTAVVKVEARRPSGAVIPGSGQTIKVIFK